MIHLLTIYIIFNNISSSPELKTAWGFAAWIETDKGSILFDTGSDGEILMENIRHFNLNPGTLDAVVISHAHWDHTGGLTHILDQVGHSVPIYIPGLSTDEMERTWPHVSFTPVSDPIEITAGFWLSGSIQGEQGQQNVDEQALFMNTDSGIVVITGCAHPGIAVIVKNAHNLFPEMHFLLVTGGFHMANSPEESVTEILQCLQNLNIQYIAPSHCTGDHVIDRFRTVWKTNFLDLSLGKTFSLQ